MPRVTEPSDPSELQRCPWPGADPLYVAYHDEEWGVPEWDDRALFEKLVLDGFQAGLSWLTILRKRDRFREVFEDFEAERIVRWDARKIESVAADASIVRNRAKILGAISSAKGYLAILEEAGSFSSFVWKAVDGRVRQNTWTAMTEVPTETAESQALSEALKARGFSFVGPTIVYAFMQATGLVNDHLVSCYRHAEVRDLPPGPPEA